MREIHNRRSFELHSHQSPSLGSSQNPPQNPSLKSSMFSTLVTLSFFTLFFAPAQASAWARRGHAISCEVASYLAADEPKGLFLKAHSFDLAYYCNAPDFIWKRPATYTREAPQHYMTMGLIDKVISERTEKIEKPFALDRASFEKTFPELKDKGGRAFWRIQELNRILGKTTEELQKKGLSKEARHGLQAKWLSVAGAIGHYVTDLAQPLHVDENHDGQLTDQKGIHAYFEGELVDQLYLTEGRSLVDQVARSARKKWQRSRKNLEKKSLLELLEDHTADSRKELSTLLKIDKRVGRKDIKKAANAHRQMLVDRLAAGAVAQAELLRRQLGWEFDDHRFYEFVSEPTYIEPGTD